MADFWPFTPTDTQNQHGTAMAMKNSNAQSSFNGSSIPSQADTPIDKKYLYSQELRNLQPGERLGKYELVARAGAGGMGAIWKAKDTVSGLFVALKFVKLELQQNEKLTEEMRQVFVRMQPLHHPNICPVLGLEKDATYGYFHVMQWLDGVTLAQYCAQRGGAKLPTDDVTQILEGVAAGLDFSHKNGVLHRDVKPSNIFLTLGENQQIQRVQLIDFGIATEAPQSSDKTGFFKMARSGTLAYMAMEQRLGDKQDARTDQFSLAVVAYELYSGQRPFVESTDYPKPAPAVAGLPDYTNAALRKALSLERKDRFTTCTEFVKALNATRLELPTIRIDDISGEISWGEIEIPQAAPIVAENLTLPAVPEEIQRKHIEIQLIKKAIQQLKNGTHPSLQQSKQAIQDAERVYKQVEAAFKKTMKKRDESWKPLSSKVQTELTKRIFENPELRIAAVCDLCPEELSYVDFANMVQVGRQIPLMEKEYQRVKEGYEGIREQVETKKQSALRDLENQLKPKQAEIPELIAKFKVQVLNQILSTCPGYDQLDAEFPFDELIPLLPAMTRYEFGWKEKPLFKEAETAWEEKRPCVKRKQEEECKRREEEAKKLFYAPSRLSAGTRRTVMVNGVEFAFRWCPAGKFKMGSPEDEEDREDNETQHEVTLTKGFWMMETEVTVGMFRSFTKATGYQSKGAIPWGWTGSTWEQDSKYSWQNPGFSQNDNHPVTCVSWDDAVAFCEWLSDQTGLKLNLPTEAQWEYACRAGTTGPYAGELDKMGWYDGNSGDHTHPVGQKQANAWGLYDMHGNVWEWCQDWYGDYPTGSVEDPTGPDGGSIRVYRGGSWGSDARDCRSAGRDGSSAGYRGSDLGFRVVGCPSK